MDSSANWQHPHALDHLPGPSTSPQPLSPTGSIDSRSTNGTKDVFHSIVAGRKSWKTARGGEVVWPPELEAALLEGLESYIPDDSRETRLLGRFPLRNRFISDYIYNKTGKRRTPKQVGSRLQQLRDTCGGKKLLSLLSPTVRPGSAPSNSIYRRAGSSTSDSSDSSTPTSPVSPTFGDNSMASWGQTFASQSVICIDILPENTSSSQIHHASPAPPPSNAIRLSSPARPLGQIDPTITFTSRSPIENSSESLFTVHQDGDVVFQDKSPVTLCDQTRDGISKDGLYFYKTVLVPNFWAKIVQSQDPTRFTIAQKVQEVDSFGNPKARYAAMYKFCYAPLTKSGAIAEYCAPAIASTSAPSSPRSISHFQQPQAQYYPDYTPSPPPFHGARSLSTGGASAPFPPQSDFDKFAAANTQSLYPFEPTMLNITTAPAMDGWNDISMGAGPYTPTSESSSDHTDYFRPGIFEDYDSSRSNSISPTTTCFPTTTACFV